MTEAVVEERAMEESHSARLLRDLTDQETIRGVASMGRSVTLRHPDVSIRWMTILIKQSFGKAYTSRLSQRTRNTSSCQATGSGIKEQYAGVSHKAIVMALDLDHTRICLARR